MIREDTAEADYYEILGVPRTADAATLRQAYKALALLHHPDKNPDQPEEAAEMFKRVGEAYTVLKDDRLRAAYDNGRGSSPFRGRHAGSDRFGTDKATELFREVFGDDFVSGLSRAQDKFNAAAEATSSAVTAALDRCMKTKPARNLAAAGISAIAADADSEVESLIQVEARCQRFLEERRQRLDEFEGEFAVERRRRTELLTHSRHRFKFAVGLSIACLALAGVTIPSSIVISGWLDPFFLLLACMFAGLESLILVWAWKCWLAFRLQSAEDEVWKQEMRQSVLVLRQDKNTAERSYESACQRAADAKVAAGRAREEMAVIEQEGTSLVDAMRIGSCVFKNVRRSLSKDRRVTESV